MELGVDKFLSEKRLSQKPFDTLLFTWIRHGGFGRGWEGMGGQSQFFHSYLIVRSCAQLGPMATQAASCLVT